MVFGIQKNSALKNKILSTFIILLLVWSVFFLILTIKDVNDSTKNVFDNAVKIRGAIEQIDMVLERAEVNVDLLGSTISNSYDLNKQNDKAYNLSYVRSIDGVVRAALANSPGMNGAWFQMNADLPFSVHTFNWYELNDNGMVNLRKELQSDPSKDRKITPEDDPYYFDAIKKNTKTWSKPYVDSDTQEKMITLSLPIYKGLALVGVAGLDISLSNLQDILKNMQSILYASELFLLDENNQVIVAQLLNNSNDDPKKDPVLNEINGNQDQAIIYFDGFTRKSAVIMTLSNKYRLVITFADQNIMGAIYNLYGIILLLFLVIILLFASPAFKDVNIPKFSSESSNENENTDQDIENILKSIDKINNEM